MKPYRVKRGSKYIGSWLVVVNGQRVNLQTKDASEARRRAALAAKGEWPEPLGKAVREVKAALEAPLEAPPAPPVEAPPAPPVEAPPAPPVEAPPAPPAPPVSVADAVNATAAASPEDEAERALKDVMGVDVGEAIQLLPAFIGSGWVKAAGAISKVPTRFIAGRWVPVPPLPPEMEPLKPIMGKLIIKKLADIGIDLEKLGPGTWLLLLTVAVVSVQSAAAVAAARAEDEKAKEPQVN